LVVREGDHDSVDVLRPVDLDEVVDTSEHGDSTDVAPQVLRLRVGEADEIDAVLGMLEDLAGDQLPDVAGADDHGVLDVAGAATDDGSRHEPHRDHPDDREEPEGRELRLIRMREPDEPGRRIEKPDADGDQVEDRYDLV